MTSRPRPPPARWAWVAVASGGQQERRRAAQAAIPVVEDADRDLVLRARHDDLDEVVWATGPERVVEQVSNHVPHQGRIGRVRGEVAWARVGDPLVVREGVLGRDGVEGDPAQGDRQPLRLQRASLQPAEDQEILHETVEALDLDDEVARHRAAVPVGEVPIGQEASPDVEGCDRRADLMREDLEEGPVGVHARRPVGAR